MNETAIVDELTALVRAVAMDPDLQVVVGPKGSGWFITPSLGRVSVDADDLVHQHPDDLRGLACHEAAHAAVTRYLSLVPPAMLAEPGMAALLNALEDCRIETWIMHRLPGARAWVQQYNDRLFPADGAGLADKPYFVQFCCGAIHDWWHGALPETLAPAVVEALTQTAEARQQVIALQPPADPHVSLDAAMAYRGSRAESAFSVRDRFSPPDGFERLVRLSAFTAWGVVWREVLPAYRSLLRLDLAHQRDVKQAEADWMRACRAATVAGGPGRATRRVLVPLPSGAAHPGAPLPASPSPSTHMSTLSAASRAAMERVVNAPPASLYERALREVAHLTDPLVAELERLLRPTSYPRWLPGYPSGSRVDLRVAMQLNVAPDAHRRLWQRKTLPSKRDPAFYLLLDLSGSMREAPIEHGFRGLVLLAEVLTRLGVPFAAHGFQDQVIRFKRFDEPLDAAMRAKLGEMPAEVYGNRPGGHNQPGDNWDGPSLRAARDELLAWPGRDRVLLVVSDGQPTGPHDAERALHQAVAAARDAVHVIGIGLGPGTEHVTRYYPEHIANVPLDQFPAALAGVITRLLGAPTHPSPHRGRP